MKLSTLFVLASISCTILLTSCSKNVKISGSLNKWEPVTIDLKSIDFKEESSTFRDYRLNITFTSNNKSYTVPGYFAADGEAANSGASSGKTWRVIFTPDESGKWNYSVSFRKGTDIAASLDPEAGEPIDLNGLTGSFVINNVNPEAKGFYAKGKLLYVGERYLRFGETGEWFIKSGPGGPENFLGYSDFDSTYNVEGGTPDSLLGDDRLHNYTPHIADWKSGDPSWKEGKGKGIIGAINYLASTGINTHYMVVNNVNGDGRDCWPWVNYEARDIYDVSKLDQWNIVLTHMNSKGIHIDFLFWEAENTGLLNNGDMGVERCIYYRELIARFGHLPAIRWNISEEPSISPSQVLENAAYISSVDPYGHAVGSECGYTVQRRDDEFPPLLGNGNFDGAWMQCHENHHNETLRWINKSDSAGHKWVVSVDESMAMLPDDADTTRQIFWDVVTAGGEGFDVYFGYVSNTSDITNEDYRNRNAIWDQLGKGVSFFQPEEINNLLPRMKNHDELGNGHILALPGEMYIIYQTQKPALLDLTDVDGDFLVRWFDPVKGGDFAAGSVEHVAGGQKVTLGMPDSNGNEWVILVKKE